MIKRLIDIAVSGAMLLLFSPLLVLVAVLVRLYLGRPVLFHQVRPGLGGKPFSICKFRTMRSAFDAQGSPLRDADRLTRFGKFLRSSSLDELPELWNVLRGEMSLVGPRPLLPEYLSLYSKRQEKRHEVRPGITGWAQVNGRNAVDWPDRFEMDVWYVENQSLALDLQILWRTVLIVLSRSGVSAENHVTMPPFMGNQEAKPTTDGGGP